MHRRLVLILIALGIGALITVGTAAGSYFADRAGSDSSGEILFWPNTLLQALISAPNVGTPEHPFYEGQSAELPCIPCELSFRYDHLNSSRLFISSSPGPNQSMKPTAPFRNSSSVFATTPCRGLSPFR